MTGPGWEPPADEVTFERRPAWEASAPNPFAPKPASRPLGRPLGGAAPPASPPVPAPSELDDLFGDDDAPAPTPAPAAPAAPAVADLADLFGDDEPASPPPAPAAEPKASGKPPAQPARKDSERKDPERKDAKPAQKAASQSSIKSGSPQPGKPTPPPAKAAPARAPKPDRAPDPAIAAALEAGFAPLPGTASAAAAKPEPSPAPKVAARAEQAAPKAQPQSSVPATAAPSSAPLRAEPEPPAIDWSSAFDPSGFDAPDTPWSALPVAAAPVAFGSLISETTRATEERQRLDRAERDAALKKPRVRAEPPSVGPAAALDDVEDEPVDDSIAEPAAPIPPAPDADAATPPAAEPGFVEPSSATHEPELDSPWPSASATPELSDLPGGDQSLPEPQSSVDVPFRAEPAPDVQELAMEEPSHAAPGFFLAAAEHSAEPVAPFPPAVVEPAPSEPAPTASLPASPARPVSAVLPPLGSAPAEAAALDPEPGFEPEPAEPVLHRAPHPTESEPEPARPAVEFFRPAPAPGSDPAIALDAAPALPVAPSPRTLPSEPAFDPFEFAAPAPHASAAPEQASPPAAAPAALADLVEVLRLAIGQSQPAVASSPGLALPVVPTVPVPEFHYPARPPRAPRREQAKMAGFSSRLTAEQAATLTVEQQTRLREEESIRRYANPNLWASVDQVLGVLQADPDLQGYIRSLELTNDRQLDAQQRQELERRVTPRLLQAQVSISNVRDVPYVFDMVYDELVGLGPLGEFWRDDEVTEIMVDGYDDVVIDRDGQLLDTKASFRSLEHAVSVARTLAAKVSDRGLSATNPAVGAELPGARAQFMVGSIVKRGISITIRKFRPLMDMNGLLEFGALDDEMAAFLHDCVRAKTTLIVSGGTGTGKTTLINALSQAIGEGERVVTIEDAYELQLASKFWVAMQTKEAASADDAVRVSQDVLLHASLRMRPDRIIVGEIRDPAGAAVMIQAASTGHDGTMTTIHADAPLVALNVRLAPMLMSAGLSDHAAKLQVSTAIGLVVQVTRRGPHRYISEISVLDPACYRDGQLVPMPLFEGSLVDGRPAFRRVGSLRTDTGLGVRLKDAGVDVTRWEQRP